MNALVAQKFNMGALPAFLQKADLSHASGLTGGIQGGLPPLISVKGSKWRIVTDGSALFVNQMHLDVVVIGFNPHVSKTYFAGEFDENNVGAPDCWSDNGTAPSSKVSTPVSPSCMTCPKAAFNSATNGRGGKACRDSKKLAVVLADTTNCMDGNVGRPLEPFKTVYLLQLPTMSMKPWKEFVDKVHGHGVPVLFGIVIRLTFDPSEAYPKIQFAPSAQVTEEYAPCLMPYLEDPAVAEVVGGNDVPFSATVLPFAGASAPPAASFTPSPIAPVVAAPASPTMPPSETPAAAPAAPRKPGRPKASAPSAVVPTATPTPPAGLVFPPQGQVAGTATPQQDSAIVTPAAATGDLDAMLAGFFAKG